MSNDQSAVHAMRHTARNGFRTTGRGHAILRAPRTSRAQHLREPVMDRSRHPRQPAIPRGERGLWATFARGGVDIAQRYSDRAAPAGSAGNRVRILVQVSARTDFLGSTCPMAVAAVAAQRTP